MMSPILGFSPSLGSAHLRVNFISGSIWWQDSCQELQASSPVRTDGCHTGLGIYSDSVKLGSLKITASIPNLHGFLKNIFIDSRDE